MAIYRLSAGIVKRSQGQSAVAAAAYRAGEDLHDERLEKTHRYTRKQDVLKSEIMAESGAPDWVYDREKMWNTFEAAERQWNGQPAREVVLSLPRELSDSDNWNLARKFVRDEFVSKGMIADVNFHKPDASDGKSNPHVHVLLTMRRLVDGEPSTKKERQWNRDFTDGGISENDKIGGFKNTKGQGDGWVGKDTTGLKGMRLRWADSANGALAENGIDARISALSNLELGKQHQPQPKVGKAWHSVDPRAAIAHKHRDEVRIANSQRSNWRAPTPYTNPYKHNKPPAPAHGQVQGKARNHGKPSPRTTSQRSSATTVAERYAQDAEILKGLYGDKHTISGQKWTAEHDNLQQQNRGDEQKLGW